MISDAMAQHEGAVFQHGPANNRVYIMDPGTLPCEKRLTWFRQFALDHQYTRLFAKIPESHLPAFEAAGYRREATIPGMFHGVQAGHFMGLALDPDRACDPRMETIRNILERSCTPGHGSPKDASSANGVRSIRQATEADAEHLAKLYQRVFPSYPFPIDSPDFIIQTMRQHTVYFLIPDPVDAGELLAASSAECYPHAGHAEMTDFATRPDQRGKGLASTLLAGMEDTARDMGITMAYTIARAMSAGMNRVFARQHYHFAGTLINNTQISGQIESMNVWFKPLISAGGPSA